MRDGYLRGALPSTATPAQMKALAAYVAAGGSVADAAELVASGRAPSSATSPTCGRGRVSPRSSLSMWGELRDG